MPIGAAIAGTIGAAGAVGSSLIGSSAAQKASGQQVALGQQALATQSGMFGQVQQALQPYINLGTQANAPGGAGATLQALLTPGANQTAALSQLPGFQFAQDWGQKATQNLGTTTGLGGNTLAAGAQFATGLAQQGFGQLTSSLQALYGSQLGAGVQAAGALGGAAGQFGSEIGGTLTGLGQSQAAGTLGSANAISGGLTGASSSISNALLLSKLFGGTGAGGAAPVGSGIYGGTQPNLGYAMYNNGTPVGIAGAGPFAQATG